MAQAVSRLALVMQALGLTGYDVSIALNIDPSLISKWKRNRRRVPGRTDTMAKIARYLFDIDEKQGGRNIKPMLENLAGGKPLAPGQEVDLLTQWLLDPDPADWYSETDIVSDVNLNSSSYTCPVEVFRGHSGRRSAVLHFLDQIRSLPSNNILQVMMLEDPCWDDDSQEFLLQFRSSVEGWLTSGHEMESVQWIDRHPDQLQNLIQNWLPFHVEHKVTTWYYPLYGNSLLPVSLYVVPGRAALVAQRSSPAPGDYHTLLFTDQATVRQYEYLFNKLRKDCLPLVDSFQFSSFSSQVARASDFWSQSRVTRICLNSLYPLLMALPLEQLMDICRENRLDTASIETIRENWHTFRQSKASCESIRIVHHLGTLELLANEPDYIDPFLSSVTGRPVIVRRHYLNLYLQALTDEYSANETLSVAMVRTDLFNRSVWPNLMVVANIYVIIWGSKTYQNRLFCQESTLVHAFERYFESRWNRIPSVCKHRETTLQLIGELSRRTPGESK